MFECQLNNSSSTSALTLPLLLLLSLTLSMALLSGCGSGVSVAPPGEEHNAVDTAAVERVLVPAGWFWMGSQPGFNWNEEPQRQVWLDSFYIGKTEVTNAQYAAFLNAILDTNRARWGWRSEMEISFTNNRFAAKSGRERYPVSWVTWDNAKVFAEWTGGRLPTEAEWEKAARGSRDRRYYPWGDHIDHTQANFDNNFDGLWPVGQAAGLSPYGCRDMAGNVWEWIADYFEEYYYRSAPNRNPQGPAYSDYRCLRGGSFMQDYLAARCSKRFADFPYTAAVDLGFRVAFNDSI